MIWLNNIGKKVFFKLFKFLLVSKQTFIFDRKQEIIKIIEKIKPAEILEFFKILI